MNPKEAFIKSYSVMDQQIIDFPIPKSGSTAVTALIKKKKKKDQKILYVANIGDARAVLWFLFFFFKKKIIIILKKF